MARTARPIPFAAPLAMFLASFALNACATPAGSTASDAPAAAPVAVQPATTMIPENAAAAVANPARSAKDRERDGRDAPAEILAFAGVQPGMTIADIFGAGGYWTELFSYAVGPSGKVLLVNNVPYWAMAREDQKSRFAEGRLPNVDRRVVETRAMGLGENSLDMAVIVLSYHDLYYSDPLDGWPGLDASGFLEQMRAAVKSGGHVLIVDHAAVAGSGNSAAQRLHRIDEEFAKADFAKHGFVLEKTFDGLRNADDPRTGLVFDPTIRGKTDRFVHLYRKR